MSENEYESPELPEDEAAYEYDEAAEMEGFESADEQLAELSLMFEMAGYAHNNGFRAPGAKELLRGLGEAKAGLEAYLADGGDAKDLEA